MASLRTLYVSLELAIRGQRFEYAERVRKQIKVQAERKCMSCEHIWTTAEDWVDYDWRGNVIQRIPMLNCLYCDEYKPSKKTCNGSKEI